MAREFSTPIPAVLEMEWLDILDDALAATHADYLDKRFQLRLAGVKIR